MPFLCLNNSFDTHTQKQVGLKTVKYRTGLNEWHISSSLIAQCKEMRGGSRSLHITVATYILWQHITCISNESVAVFCCSLLLTCIKVRVSGCPLSTRIGNQSKPLPYVKWWSVTQLHTLSFEKLSCKPYSTQNSYLILSSLFKNELKHVENFFWPFFFFFKWNFLLHPCLPPFFSVVQFVVLFRQNQDSETVHDTNWRRDCVKLKSRL